MMTQLQLTASDHERIEVLTQEFVREGWQLREADRMAFECWWKEARSAGVDLTDPEPEHHLATSVRQPRRVSTNRSPGHPTLPTRWTPH